jgi:uncharacterized circularly permuted ATP-grasp superfamily protein/uncharacterized alpha-E superfamily protein
MHARAQTDNDQTVRERLMGWVGDYRPLPGIPDEYIGPDGAPRSHWTQLLGLLGELSPEEIAQRFGAADRHIREAGISYRIYGEAGERSWPISHLPLLISEREWRDIAAGVEQRVTLLEKVLADFYGEGGLVSEGALPASAITGSAEFLRPLHGMTPPGGRYLHLYAADLGRGPDGRWWVLGDRAQAPSGAGYALENRLVLSRAFPSLYQEMNVERLAPFFAGFRAGLTAASVRSEPRICLLTSGPHSETYFEQAYLARYLGFVLVEGDDLVAHNNRVNVRTIAGLKRADVIWRRIDSDFVDPLELNTASRLGVPGLLEAVRRKGVVVANMPGTGLVEAPALLGFLPALSRRILGEDLRMPNIATWWCGQPRERQLVLDNIDRFAVASAFGRPLPVLRNGRPTLGSHLDPDARAKLIAAIDDRPMDFVGQEVVRLSTMPAWEEGRLEPRPFTLRVFAAATPDGWKVMPGGFCRVSDRLDARAVYMGEGVRSADVWVLAEKPVQLATLLPTTETVKIRRILGNLPSGAADNLFWLGRYLERAEATLRVVRALSSSLIDAPAPGSAPATGAARPAIERLRRILVAWGAVPRDSAHTAAGDAAVALHDTARYGSAISIVKASRRAASSIRERLSADTWQFLSELEGRLGQPATRNASEPELFGRADRALRVIAALSGLSQENMNRVAGWRFLDIGRRIERGINTARFGRQFAPDDATVDDLDVLLDLIDSQITYRSRYLVGPALAPVRDMVALDPFNPRSIAFQVEAIDRHLEMLPSLREDGLLETPRRLIISLATEISTEAAESLDNAKLLAFEQKLMALANEIAARYFLHGLNEVRQERLTGLG